MRKWTRWGAVFAVTLSGGVAYEASAYHARGALALELAQNLTLDNGRVLYERPHAEETFWASTIAWCAPHPADCWPTRERCAMLSYACRKAEVTVLARGTPAGDHEHPWCSANWFGPRRCIVSLRKPDGTSQLAAASIW